VCKKSLCLYLEKLYSKCMPAFTSNLVLSMLLAFVGVLTMIAFYYKDKYNKTHDELLDLADKRGFFSKKSSIMRQDERLFFDFLMKLYGEKYFIFPQVRLAAILDVKNDVKDHDNLYRLIDHLSLDFVIFDKTAMSPLIAVELNGKSHMQFNRRNRDQKVINVLTKAGIQFIAIAVADSYDEGAVRQQIDPLLSHSS